MVSIENFGKSLEEHQLNAITALSDEWHKIQTDENERMKIAGGVLGTTAVALAFTPLGRDVGKLFSEGSRELGFGLGLGRPPFALARAGSEAALGPEDFSLIGGTPELGKIETWLTDKGGWTRYRRNRGGFALRAQQQAPRETELEAQRRAEQAALELEQQRLERNDKISRIAINVGTAGSLLAIAASTLSWYENAHKRK